ncbi:MAG: permease [Nitrososphaerota archaeon]
MISPLLLILLSLPAGLLGALTGLGGASILIPILVLLGLPLKTAIATGMVVIIATSSGSAAYVKEGLANVRAAMYLELFTILGAIAGATITSLLPSKPLYFLFAAFLLFSFFGLRGRPTQGQGEVVQDRLARWLRLEGSYYDQELGRMVNYKLTNPVLGGLGMAFAGLAAGMLGIGAGAFKVSVHELILRMPPKVSTTTSNFIIGMTALAGASVYFNSGLLYVDLAAPAAIGTALGAVLGSKFLPRMRGRTLRALFLALVLYLIAQMVLRGLAG